MTNSKHEEFVVLFARHQPAVFGYIYSLIPNWTEAEDAFQRTSLILWQKFDDYRPGTDFARWACTVARFVVLKRFRERARDRLVFSDDVLECLAEEGVDALELRAEERSALAECVQRVPVGDRSLLEGYYGRNVAVADLATDFETTVAAVYKRLSRIRAVLQRCVEMKLKK